MRQLSTGLSDRPFQTTDMSVSHMAFDLQGSIAVCQFRGSVYSTSKGKISSTSLFLAGSSLQLGLIVVYHGLG